VQPLYTIYTHTQHNNKMGLNAIDAWHYDPIKQQTENSKRQISNPSRIAAYTYKLTPYQIPPVALHVPQRIQQQHCHQSPADRIDQPFRKLGVKL